jgi:ribulose-phosphate 3-epimerase
LKISASIQASNIYNLLEELETHKDSFDQLHVDITDGNFTDNISLPIAIIDHIKKNTDYVVDTHLMLNNNELFTNKAFEYGSDIVTVHCETTTPEIYSKLVDKYTYVGVGILPGTNLNVLSDYIEKAFSVLLLTVNPGFSNQNKAINLIERINEFKNSYPNYSNLLIVDGGVKNEELDTLEDLGIDIAVQGGAIFAK